MRRAAHVDANQALVVEALRKMGCSVTSLATVGKGCPDLLVGYRGLTLLLEVKNRRGRNRVEPSQTEWHARWRGAPVLVVYSPEEAAGAVWGHYRGIQAREEGLVVT